jgi:thiosulfate/3-mercaptopyruvate sulfurtransferase
MRAEEKFKSAKTLASAAVIALFAVGAAHLLHGAPGPAGQAAAAAQQTTPPPSAQEIPASQTIQPDELAKQIAGKDKPVVVCVAPRFLYDGAHIPGALFHGPASRPDGLNDLRQWAKGAPRDANIVLYCGCCPLTRCPNVRPALAALRDMGFTHVKVLWLPQDFHTDWIEKGYPVEKGP